MSESDVATVAESGREAIAAMLLLMPQIEAIGPTLAGVVQLYSSAAVRAAAGELERAEWIAAITATMRATEALTTLHISFVASMGQMDHVLMATDALARGIKSIPHP